MNDVVIHIENLSKKYRLGILGTRTFTRDVQSWWARKRGADDPNSKIDQAHRYHRQTDASDSFWALQDINLEVHQGEVLGIIGKNGAGKSTLLKILSRVTAPTTGEVRVRGRIASLLEVGTGFHPELTGRENIYLNGTILGMKRREIDRKLDEIVDFAEIEKFMDTPVKRYSSGMYVRLAFAVAAHLDPNILVIDEVLAVGDEAFQKKCLGKMDAVAHDGKTILFVSHNMQAVKALCHNTLLLRGGRSAGLFETGRAIEEYLDVHAEHACERIWESGQGPGNADLRLLRVAVLNQDLEPVVTFKSSEEIIVAIEFDCQISHSALCVGYDLMTAQGDTVYRTYQTDMIAGEQPEITKGRNILINRVPPGLLNGNRYSICPRIGLHNINWIVNEDALVQFDVQLDHSDSSFWLSLKGHESRPGTVSPILQWKRLDE